MAMRSALLILLSAVGTHSQMFGNLPAAPPRDQCPYVDFQARTQVVQDACCPTPADCATGLPLECNMACGAVFVHFFHQCETLMETVMGHDQTHVFSDFDKVCKRQDQGELLMMVYSMSVQGCSIDTVDPNDAAQLAADIQLDDAAQHTGGLGLGGAAEHFANELAHCEWDDVQRKIDNIEHACCSDRDADDSCDNHLPSNCDLECAVAFVPFLEDCRTVIAGPLHDQLAGFEELYQTCQSSTRQDTLGLLRAIYNTQEHYDDNNLVGNPARAVCPVRGSLEFFSDCPGLEADCIMQYIGSNSTLSNMHVYQSYRFKVHSTQSHGGLLCHDEIFFAGPGMCRHEMTPDSFTAGPDVMTGHSCVEQAVLDGADSVPDDAALCAAITGTDRATGLGAAGPCNAQMTTADPTVQACRYVDPTVRDHSGYYSAGYEPSKLGDSPSNIMVNGGSGSSYCSYPQTYWLNWDDQTIPGNDLSLNGNENWEDRTAHPYSSAQCDPGNPTGLNEGYVGGEKPTFGDPLLCEHWLRYDFTEPTEVTAYIIKARNAPEAMSDFEWQGSNDGGVTWTTIEYRHVNSWVSRQPKVFVVGSPLYEEAAPGVPADVFDMAFSNWAADPTNGGVDTCAQRAADAAANGGH